MFVWARVALSHAGVLRVALTDYSLVCIVRQRVFSQCVVRARSVLGLVCVCRGWGRTPLPAAPVSVTVCVVRFQQSFRQQALSVSEAGMYCCTLSLLDCLSVCLTLLIDRMLFSSLNYVWSSIDRSIDRFDSLID